MGNKYRSLKGCWTCRVRKRKCDEKVPICSACGSLELECHGYEEQPIWMDRGSKQKAEAIKIKQMVADLSSTFVTTPTTTQRHSWGLEAVFPYSAASSHSDGSDHEFAPLNDTLSDFLPSDLFFPESQALSHEIELLHSNGYTFECDLLSPPNIQLQTNKVAWPQPAKVPELMSGSGHSSSQKNHPVIFNKPALAIDKLGDATILAYYFEKVFNWQFLSCQSHSSAFNQGHIMWLVSKSQPLCHATLALSSSHKYLQTNTTIDEHTPQYDVAIKELHTELQNPKSYEDVSI
ncbi:uncharacterized protein EAE97_003965 [Botrytis byssoidea]|uniref:Zn(2)-C6 fungal-type domain-containing protein n=1 Tax=Botrytis byssoidea TaxID=139641 RepID=A0A9P5LWR5_9HELO|nr:uncharacterized protein EAE97_003965 [Botrytis byssoidea]KAF7948554.1 hypothetical protein EAE97_003965 [Botrytis byssoidea]